jgi:hypothetical protein
MDYSQLQQALKAPRMKGPALDFIAPRDQIEPSRLNDGLRPQ